MSVVQSLLRTLPRPLSLLRSVCAGLLLTGLCSALHAGEELVAVGRATEAPVLDGVLSDAAWRHAIELTNFIQLKNHGTVARRATRVKVTYDECNLYIGFVCMEPLVNPVFNKLHEFKASCRRRDDASIWADDMCEIFLAPDAANVRNYYHIAFNSLGTLYDTMGTINNACNLGIRVATKTFVQGHAISDDRSGWAAELAIPLKDLKVSVPRPGTVWKANFCRVSRTIDEVSSWTQVNGRFHDPGSFGKLVFRESVPGVRQISAASFRSGKNVYSGISDAPVIAEVRGQFDNGDAVEFADRQTKSGAFAVPFSLSCDNIGYRFIEKNPKGGTSTFLMSGKVNLRPGRSYTVRVKSKSDYSWNNQPNSYSYFFLVDQNETYYNFPLMTPCTTKGVWTMQTGRFVNKKSTYGGIWAIKWAGRNLKGQVDFDDFSMVDDETGEELFPNGDFSLGPQNWRLYLRDRVVPSYGAKAERATLHYALKSADGQELYRSANYSFRMVKSYDAIHAEAVRYGSTGPLKQAQFKLCAGTPESMRFLLTSDRQKSIRTATLEILLPQDVRMMPPSQNTVGMAPLSVKESSLDRGGKTLRRYLVTLDRNLVFGKDVSELMTGAVTLHFLADTTARGKVGALEYRASLDDGSVEPAFHRLPLEVLEPLYGAQPSADLPVILWIYGDCTAMNGWSEDMVSRQDEKIALSGYNMIPVGAEHGAKLRKVGITPFAVLPSLTLTGPYFPMVQKFVKEHPEYAAVNARGQRTETMDPAVLLSDDNPFLPFMRKVFKRYSEAYPEDWQVDYEFSFMPQTPGTLPGGIGVIGYSQRNVDLFRKAYGIKETLTPLDIQKKYPLQWRTFRNKQNADTMGLYSKLQKELNLKGRFSIYSGYPPAAEQIYGIDWKAVSPQIDMCSAGYGGDTKTMFKQIRQSFINSGVLLMGYVDSARMTEELSGMLLGTGSYMAFLFHTVDGEFFRNSSLVAALAADYEPFLRNFRHARKTMLAVDATSGKSLGNALSFAWNGRIFVALTNPEKTARTFDLKISCPQGMVAVQHSSKKPVTMRNGRVRVTVAPYGVDALLLVDGQELKDLVPLAPTPRPTSSLINPILRWRSDNGTLESYEVRYGNTESSLDKAPVRVSVTPYLQTSCAVADASPVLYWQVRAVSAAGRRSAWSPVTRQTRQSYAKLDIKRNLSWGGSAAKLGCWNTLVWGGGGHFARLTVDGKVFFPGDTGSLRIDNEFDTTRSAWIANGGSGEHTVFQQVRPGERYELTAMVRKTGDIQVDIGMSCLDNQGGEYWGGNRAVKGAVQGEWQELKSIYTVPRHGRFLNLCLSGNGGPGTVWFSDFKLKKLD